MARHVSRPEDARNDREVVITEYHKKHKRWSETGMAEKQGTQKWHG